MSINPILLSAIIAESAPNASAVPPFGYCWRNASEASDLSELAAAGMVRLNTADPNYGIPVMPTETAIKWNAEATRAPHTPVAPVSRAAPVVVIEDNIPVPDMARKRGFGHEGPSLIDVWHFNDLTIGQSFFVSQEYATDPETPIHRSFASTVSNANKKLFPKKFIIQASAGSNGEPGARVWRIDDMTSAPTVRKRRTKAELEAERLTQATAQPPTGYAPAPAAYPAPGAPAPFPGSPGAPAPFAPPFPGAPAPAPAPFAPPFASAPAPTTPGFLPPPVGFVPN